MLMGLKEGQEKMSKSDPDSAIFMEDTVEDVNRKIKRAFCRPKEVEGNPIIDYYKHIIFPYLEIDDLMLVIDKKEWGGIKSYTNFADFEEDYKSGVLHPSDIKPKLASEINRLIEPVRRHFATNDEAKSLLNQVKKFKITK
jgi:tyrosyl-tRNA synthetase